MARGKDQHDARKAAVAGLGKALSRRARSHCELCDGDEDLRVIEIAPVEEEPTEDAALLACLRCRDLLDAKKLPRDTADLRFLEGSAWSELLPVQITAIRLLRRLAVDQVTWAVDCLDGLWLPDDVAEKVDAS